MKISKIILSCGACAVFVIMPTFVRGASMSVVLKQGGPQPGQPITASIILDAGEDSANAVQGTVVYPTSLLDFQIISDGDSPVAFWIVPPAEHTSGTIDFAGIIPGGILGTSTLFSFILDPIASGTANFQLTSGTVLRNDGEGTSIPLVLNGASIFVSPPAGGIAEPLAGSSVIPNTFTPVISRDPNMFGGEYFLVFSTIDKGSGIDHYEVLEVPAGGGSGPLAPWQTVQSPYLLKDQSLGSDIYVRAVDHVGNFIVVKVPTQHVRSVSSGLESIMVAGGLLLIVVLFLVWNGRRNRSV